MLSLQEYLVFTLYNDFGTHSAVLMQLLMMVLGICIRSHVHLTLHEIPGCKGLFRALYHGGKMVIEFVNFLLLVSFYSSPCVFAGNPLPLKTMCTLSLIIVRWLQRQAMRIEST